MKQSLVLLDTDHIKQYVFATDKLKEIRGASALLDELNRIWMTKRLHRLFRSVGGVEGYDPVIYANGGAGMFVVPSEYAQTFIQIVRRKYWRRTITGSITGVAEELPENWNPSDNTKQVHAVMQRLAYKKEIVSAENREHVAMRSYALFRDCDSCDTEYATEIYEEELLCRSCVLKRKKDQQIKALIRQDIRPLLQRTEQSAPTSKQLWHRLLFSLRNDLLFLKDEFETNELDRPQDVSELGELSTPANYLGLIYADGNNMRKILTTIDTLPAMKAFSETVDEAIYHAVGKAVSRYLPPVYHKNSNQWRFPFDVLLLGGDDLVMICTAHTTIDVAIAVVNEFQAETQRRFNDDMTKSLFNEKTWELIHNGVTLSASLVLAHAKYPFGSMLALADNALKFTKTGYSKLRREEQDVTCKGMVNFMVVNASNSLDFKDIYRYDLRGQDPDSGAIAYRTLRPYSVEQMEQLQDGIKNFVHGVPKTKLHQLRDAIFLGINRGMLETLATLLRAKEQHKEYIKKFIKQFAGDAQDFAYPWYRVQKKGKAEYYTPLLDAIELYDFVE